MDWLYDMERIQFKQTQHSERIHYSPILQGTAIQPSDIPPYKIIHLDDGIQQFESILLAIILVEIIILL
jgi:hypothetical protein